jgi:hypothetical protein
MLIGVAATYFIISARYDERLSTAEDRVKLAHEHVAAYKDKLQGASPDEAASQIKSLQASLSVMSDHFTEVTRRLETTITSLEATIQAQENRISRLGEKTQDSHSGSSRIQILNLMFHTSGDPLRVNVNFKNAGTVPSIGKIHSYAGFVADGEVADVDIDQIFNLLKNNIKDVESRKVTSELEPGEEGFFTADLPTVSRENFDKVKSEGKYLYFVILMEYKDSTLPEGKWRATEGCFFTFGQDAMHKCTDHNRIFISD